MFIFDKSEVCVAHTSVCLGFGEVVLLDWTFQTVESEAEIELLDTWLWSQDLVVDIGKHP